LAGIHADRKRHIPINNEFTSTKPVWILDKERLASHQKSTSAADSNAHMWKGAGPPHASSYLHKNVSFSKIPHNDERRSKPISQRVDVLQFLSILRAPLSVAGTYYALQVRSGTSRVQSRKPRWCYF
jgi:hypothetical protein